MSAIAKILAVARSLVSRLLKIATRVEPWLHLVLLIWLLVEFISKSGRHVA